MSGHTKGPWRAAEVTARLNYARHHTILWEDRSTSGVHCRRLDDSGMFTEKDARLIAAAPEMLQALESLQTEIRRAVKFDVGKHYSLMLADVAASKAIAKTRGED